MAPSLMTDEDFIISLEGDTFDSALSNGRDPDPTSSAFSNNGRSSNMSQSLHSETITKPSTG